MEPFDGGVHMHKIRDSLYLGSAYAEQGPLAPLTQAGITHVVQVLDYPWPAHPEELVYCKVHVMDTENEDLLSKIRRAGVHDFIDQATKTGGKVLVHCQAGISRSATTVVTYLMSREGLRFEEALIDVMRSRSFVEPNRGFCRQLQVLETEFGGNLDAYRQQPLEDLDSVLSYKQYLELLRRCQSQASAGSVREVFGVDADSEDDESPRMTIAVLLDRLEARKQLGRAGHYVGVSPPSEED